MAKRPYKGNYLNVEFRVSYDKTTNSIHLTSKDEDLQGEDGFHLTLNEGRKAEQALRNLLEKYGMIPDEKVNNMPGSVLFDSSKFHNDWKKFALGVYSDGEESIWEPAVSPHMMLIGAAGTGKSVIQRSILFHCIQNAENWAVFGIDVNGIELHRYAEYDNAVAGVATNFLDGLEVLRYVSEEMFRRYQEMEEFGVNHVNNMPEKRKSVMVMIDESTVFLTPSPLKTDEGKAINDAKKEASKIILDIARLGRAAGVHLIMSAQRPDLEIFYGELRQNFTTRIAAGRADSISSSLTLDNDDATKLPRIKGRGYIQHNGSGREFQSYYTPVDWLKKNGKPLN